MVVSADRETLRFLRAAAAELRELAEQAPEIAADLRCLADDITAEADMVAKKLADTG